LRYYNSIFLCHRQEGISKNLSPGYWFFAQLLSSQFVHFVKTFHFVQNKDCILQNSGLYCVHEEIGNVSNSPEN